MSKTLNIIFTIVGIILVALIILVILSTFNENLNKPVKDDAEENNQIPTQQEEIDFDFGDVEDVDELVIETLEEGDGQEAQDGDELTLHYTGRLLNGEVFDSSLNRGDPFVFTLGEGLVIQGWEEGVRGMKIGENRLLTIPSSMGYGESGAGANIPPNAGLEFEIELLEINSAE